MTIEYHDGHPLGILLGMLRPVDAASTATVFKPIAIGLGTTIKPEVDSVLYLRVNDSPARLADNVGTLEVSVD